MTIIGQMGAIKPESTGTIRAKTSSPIWEMIIQRETPRMTRPSAVAVPPSDSEWNHVRDTIHQGFIQRLAKAQARGVFVASFAWRCRLIVKRGLERFLDKFFGLFDSGINTGGNEALANEPILINNGIGSDEDCISFVDVFGREVASHTGVTGRNLKD